MAFFDTESDFGVNYGGVPSFSFKDTFDLDTDRINDISYGSSGGMNAISSISKVLDALDKAKTYKAQNSSSLDSGGFGGTTAEQIGKNLTLVTRGPKKITQTAGTSGGLGSAIGTIAGIGASFIPGVGPAVGALLPKVGGTVGGLFG